MNIPSDLLDEVVAHALEDPKNEVCGVVAREPRPENDHKPARAVGVYRATNIHVSPLKFEIHPKELYELNTEIEANGWEIGAIYHSHVRSNPYPSQTDVSFAAGWPGVEWIIVGLISSEPEVRCYLIEGADVQEVALEVR